MELKDFVGLHEYGGVELGTNSEYDAEYVIFMLDGNCYKIEEDPSDGWRSYAKGVEEYHGEMSRRCILPCVHLQENLSNHPYECQSDVLLFYRTGATHSRVLRRLFAAPIARRL